MLSDFQYNEKNKTSVLTLEGELTIENIADLKTIFMEALTQSSHLTINHNKADKFDFSYIQLLAAVNKTATMLNKKLLLADSSPSEFQTLVKESGFNNESFFNKNN